MSASTAAAALASALIVALPAADDPAVLAMMVHMPRVERRVGDRTVVVQPGYYAIDEVVAVGPFGRTRVYAEIAADRLIATAAGDSSRRVVSAVNLARWFVWIERAGAVNNTKPAARTDGMHRGRRERHAAMTSTPAAPVEDIVAAAHAPQPKKRRGRPPKAVTLPGDAITSSAP